MKKIKSMLLMLSILAMAAPAWAADTKLALADKQATAPAAETGKPALNKKASKQKVIGGPTTTTGCANGCILMQCPPGTPAVCAKKTQTGCTWVGC